MITSYAHTRRSGAQRHVLVHVFSLAWLINMIEAMVRPFVVLVSIVFGANLSPAQSYRLDWEGANGLDGWYTHDGTPLQVAPGLASNTSVLVAPSGGTDSVAWIYHPLPFHPSRFYDFGTWYQADEAGASMDIFLSWVDPLDQAHYGWASPIYGGPPNLGPWYTNSPEPMALTDVTDWSSMGWQFCLVIQVTSASGVGVRYDDVSVDILPLASTGVRVRVILGGPDQNLNFPMDDGLRDLGLVPAVEPYSAMGYSQAGGGGGETATGGQLEDAGVLGHVDWIRVELRSASDPTVVVATKQALVDMAGVVRDHDDGQILVFHVAPGNYHVAVQHRNHLGCMTASPLTLQTPDQSVTVDFRSATTPTWGTNARKSLGTYMALWPGDTTGDAVVKYVGNSNDRDPILVAVGGNIPTATVSNVYSSLDVNMDGTLKYMGAGNDRDPILVTIGAVPTGTRLEQLP